MAQRQFRSDDTSKWLEKYGKGKVGNVAPTGTTTDDQAVAKVQGSVSTKALTYANLVGTPQVGDIMFIVQAVGTDATTAPNYEFNVLKTDDGAGNFTTKYNLTRNWNNGAQVYFLRQHKKWTLDGGAVINIRTFDGNVGGYFIRLANKKIYINVGTIEGTGKGLAGGGNENTGGGSQAQAGASPSNNANPGQITPNEGGGGGAQDTGQGQGASGGGGGNYATGGYGTQQSNFYGVGGNSIPKTQLKVITMGPAGGGGMGFGGNDNGGVGGWGGTVVILIAPDIEITDNAVINIAGEAGNTRGNSGGSTGSGGGGGASGDFLAKGERVKIGNARINNSGGIGGGGQNTGGVGSIGYGHVDFARSFTGTLLNNASLTNRQDKTLNRRPSPAGLFALLSKSR